MTADLRDVRTQLLIAVAVLLLLDLAAVAVLLSPAGRSRSARQQKYEQLRLVKMEQARTAVSTQGMDQKIATAREQEQDFDRDRLTERYSAMSEQLSHIAGEAGVSVTDVKYDEQESKAKDKSTPPGYESIGIAIQVHGSYAQDMRFINAVERQKMLLLIDAVSFSGMQGEELTVSVHLTTFFEERGMKAAAPGKTKQWLAIALVLTAIFMVVRAVVPSGGGAPAPVTVSTAPAKGSAPAGDESLDPRLHLDLLASSEAVKYEGEGKNIFRATAEVVAIPPVKVSPLLAKQQQDAAAKAAQAANVPPPPPPINLKFFGFSNKAGETPKAFLSQGDDVWIAHEGDVVDRHYKIVHISPTAVEVEDLLNSNRQSIRLTQG